MNVVLIFGAGNKAKEITRCIDKTRNEILYYVDNDPDKQGSELFGKKIISPGDIIGLEYNYILVASIYWREIREQLISLGINSKIIKCFWLQVLEKSPMGG